MTNNELLTHITHIEHILDEILPSIPFADCVTLEIDQQRLYVHTPEAIQLVSEGLHRLCSSRLEALEYEAGIRASHIQTNLSALTQGVQHG